MNNVRKITGFILVGIIIVFTLVAILGIWGLIDLEEVITKALTSLLVVFIASAVILFYNSIDKRRSGTRSAKLI